MSIGEIKIALPEGSSVLAGRKPGWDAIIADRQNQALLTKFSSGLQQVYRYIDDYWDEMERFPFHYFLGAARDCKIPEEGKPEADPVQKTATLYIAPTEDMEKVQALLDEARKEAKRRFAAGEAEEYNEIEVAFLERKANGQLAIPEGAEHGLLYLPHPYMVPAAGSRFDEMYNWDSAFIARGLLQKGKFCEAKNVADNMLYQIEHYGTVLNGTRSYYLGKEKHRSQPPLLASTILDIYNNYDAIPEPKEEKTVWLARAAAMAERYHQHWLTPPHYDAATGLSRYDSFNDAPCPEVVTSEPGHYKHALEELAKRHIQLRKARPKHASPEFYPYRHRKDALYIDTYLDNSDAPHAGWDAAGSDDCTDSLRELLQASGAGPDFIRHAGVTSARYMEHEGRPLLQLELTDGSSEYLTLSKDFYRGCWAMRESGFDPTRRFGFFGVDVINYLPVCLNSLRAKSEDGLGRIYALLAQDDPERASRWNKKSDQWKDQFERTRAAMREHLWDPGVEHPNSPGASAKPEERIWIRPPGYRDRHTDPEQCRRYGIDIFRDYDFATGFFPLWAGVATPEQAEATQRHLLKSLKTPYGLMTSRRDGGKLSGSQWDEPFLWAPLQVVAVEALEREDYYHSALDLALSYLEMQIKDFKKTGKLYEKAQGRTGTSDTARFVNKGYKTNVAGFGWTNSSIIDLCYAIERLQQKIRDPESVSATTDITVNFGVRTAGSVRPAKDGISQLSPCHRKFLDTDIRSLLPPELADRLPPRNDPNYAKAANARMN